VVCASSNTVSRTGATAIDGQRAGIPTSNTGKCLGYLSRSPCKSNVCICGCTRRCGPMHAGRVPAAWHRPADRRPRAGVWVSVLPLWSGPPSRTCVRQCNSATGAGVLQSKSKSNKSGAGTRGARSEWVAAGPRPTTRYVHGSWVLDRHTTDSQIR
jgi:hypothetical protein